jgi:hypothetical protein
MAQHAKLSASGSSRWLNCPGSIKAEEPYLSPDAASNVYAQEGTLAHAIADYCLKEEIDANFCESLTLKSLKIESEGYEPSHIVEREMTNYVQEYLDYVLSHETGTSTLYTEERVDFSNVVPEGFGTLDAAVLNYDDRMLHIFDLKYGKGVQVDAFENTQGQMYALGMYNELMFLDAFDSVRIHIVQPRLSNFSYWDISIKDLVKFGKWVAERAELALSDNAPRVPGEKQCQWCAAKDNCKALYDFTSDIISADFDDLDNIDPNIMTHEHKKRLLDCQSLIESFLSANKDSVYNDLLEGKKFKGYKIVEGRANRKWIDEAEDILFKKLGVQAHKKTLIGLGVAEKLLSKKQVDELTIKPTGAPTLVPESDKRKAMSIINIEDEFEDLENGMG